MYKRVSGTLTSGIAPFLLVLTLSLPGALQAQVPVDDSGEPRTSNNNDPGNGVEAQSPDDHERILSDAELEELVGPVALYPDKLLAIVLPASTYPLQIVQAARFLEELEEDSNLQPDESWDDSVTALLNYPEVVRMMDEDIDWTWRLGEAVIQQQADVVAAVETFRDRAYAAGNLKTDRRQTVTSNDQGAIEIEPVEEDIIYVPYYEPERVVHHQPRTVYYYYPRAYPVYYYPYPRHHSFFHGYFWGVTTAFQIGWATDHLHVWHSSYWGHPYYGRHYLGHYYRRPPIQVYNNWYVDNRHHHVGDRHRDGDVWRPRHDVGARPGYRDRVARVRDSRRERTSEGYRRRDGSRGAGFSAGETRGTETVRAGFAASREQARSKQREETADTAERDFRFQSRGRTVPRAESRPRESATSRSWQGRGSGNLESDMAIRFRTHEPAPDAARPSAASPRASRAAEPPATRTEVSRPPATSRSAPHTTAPARMPPRAAAPARSTPRAAAPVRSARPALQARPAPRSAPAATGRAAPARDNSATGSRRARQRQ